MDMIFIRLNRTESSMRIIMVQVNPLFYYNNKFIFLQVVKLYRKREQSYNFVN